GHGTGPFDAVLVAAACTAAQQEDWSALVWLNTLLWVGSVPPTLRHASRDLGEQLLGLAAAWPWAEASVTRMRAVMAGISATGQWHHAIVIGSLAAAAGARRSGAGAVHLLHAALGRSRAGGAAGAR